jgi:hypothetical protein
MRLQAIRRRESLGRPAPGSRALEASPPNLDSVGGDLGVFLLTDEVELGGADGAVPGELIFLY